MRVPGVRVILLAMVVMEKGFFTRRGTTITAGLMGKLGFKIRNATSMFADTKSLRKTITNSAM